MTGENFAVKQFPKNAKTKMYHYSANNELEFFNTLFPTMFDYGQMPMIDLVKYPGMQSISRLVAHQEDSKDMWLIYELGAKTLSQRLCVLKGQEKTKKSDQVYSIFHHAFYDIYLKDQQILVQVIKRVAQALDVFQQFNLVHSDLKTDNILIELDSQNTQLLDVKIVDFGSSFKYQVDMNLSAATPEYLPPEVLKYLGEL